MATIKAVLIDFDDTLCMSEAACFDLENETLRRMYRPAQKRDVHKQTWGVALGTAMQLRSPGLDLQEFWQIFPIVHEEFVRAGLVDVIPEANLQVLAELRKQNLSVMILTSRTETESLHLLRPDHKLASYIDAFYHKDNMQWHKPDPRAFAHIEKDHGLKPQECVYVGDAVTDAAAAKGADLHFIASLESGLLTPQDFAAYTVDAFITSFTELPRAITELTEKVKT